MARRPHRFRLATWREALAALAAVAAVVAVIALVRNSRALSPGDRLEFNGGELFYTRAVPRADAERLGGYLVGEGYFDGEPKTVQLDRHGGTYEVRVVVKKGIDTDPVYVAAARRLAGGISRAVFGGARVDVHLCDEHLSTLRVVPAPPD